MVRGWCVGGGCSGGEVGGVFCVLCTVRASTSMSCSFLCMRLRVLAFVPYVFLIFFNFDFDFFGKIFILGMAPGGVHRPGGFRANEMLQSRLSTHQHLRSHIPPACPNAAGICYTTNQPTDQPTTMVPDTGLPRAPPRWMPRSQPSPAWRTRRLAAQPCRPRWRRVRR